MSDPSKRLTNPLFSASVTGGTFEDFAQNAILLPAKEKPPPRTLNLSHEDILNDIISNSTKSSQETPNVEQQAHFSGFSENPAACNIPFPESYSQPGLNTQQLPDLSTLQPHLAAPPPQTSHLSSVFSSFSNILNIGISTSNNNNNQKEDVVPPPAGIENLIGQNNNSEPVPLFSANSVEFQLPKVPQVSGPVNQFRRPGLKRPAYAQIPGLSNNPQHVQPQNFSTQSIPLLPPVPQPPVNVPTSIISPSPTNSVSSASSIEIAQSLPNHFKPISPPPPNLQSTYSASHPIAPVPLQSKPFPNFASYTTPISESPSLTPSFQSSTGVSSSTSFATTSSLTNLATTSSLNSTINLIHPASAGQTQKSILSPVMSAIPASEIPQNANINNSHVNPVPISVTPPDSKDDLNQSTSQVYRPVYHHWFYQKDPDDKKTWLPFSMVDSLALEHAFTSNDLDPDKVIATDGGRYDVNILRRKRNAVYWTAVSTEVKRCSWFYKSSVNGKLIPYEENVATLLEEQYKMAFESNQWQKTIQLAEGETVVLHGPDVMVVFSAQQSSDTWGNSAITRARVVKRGMDEFDIDEGEPAHVDHILFMVHGIGPACDLRLRKVEEVVNEFRAIAFQLVQSHYRSSCETGKVNRIEVLPINWYTKLHSEETGVDQQLERITLESIPKLRAFTNGTILDALFYTSPVYSQTIISLVGNELNRLYDLFRKRNPYFKGGVSLAGHSLGSLVLFDLLYHQDSTPEPANDENSETIPQKKNAYKTRKMSKKINYMMGPKGTGQPEINYPHLSFEPTAFFALGSPIGMFIIVRGLDELGENFSLPTCPLFFNIFHPYDPVAYRIEPLINPALAQLKPALIPHHKGRKRMHLELKETMARVSADLKQKVIDSMRSTWNSVYQLAMFHKQTPPSLEEEVSKAFQDQIKEVSDADPLNQASDISAGKLNNGRRVDYVLQEAPLEFINDYVFAVTSHVVYWESEDTVLMILKEIYNTLDIQSDSQIPQQTMTIERPPPSPTSLRSLKFTSSAQQPKGMDPTLPMQTSNNIQPPPITGFVRKT